MHATHDMIGELARAVLAGRSLAVEQALVLTQVNGEALYDLFHWANRIRLHFVGPAVHACSIVAGKTGSCEQDCKFCSQSAHYRTHASGMTAMGADAIVAAAREASANGASCFGLVNSGFGPTDQEIDLFAESVRRVCRETTVVLCASLGVLNESQAQRLYDLGVRKYNHNLQTSRRFFPSVCTTHTYDERIDTVRACRRVGMKTCCGGLFGMGETWEDRVELAVELRNLAVDIVPVNFLIPIPGTPLAGQAGLTAVECLKILAVYRFLLPDRTIHVCGGREVHLRDLQSWMFYAGANGLLMGNYLTTRGRSAQQDLQMLHDLRIPLAGAARVPDNASALHEQVARYVPTARA
jgi:biotin synthase